VLYKYVINIIINIIIIITTHINYSIECHHIQRSGNDLGEMCGTISLPLPVVRPTVVPKGSVRRIADVLDVRLTSTLSIRHCVCWVGRGCLFYTSLT